MVGRGDVRFREPIADLLVDIGSISQSDEVEVAERDDLGRQHRQLATNQIADERPAGDPLPPCLPRSPHHQVGAAADKLGQAASTIRPVALAGVSVIFLTSPRLAGRGIEHVSGVLLSEDRTRWRLA